ncbi:cobalt/nickel transport system permease protein [Herbihabitans rhizosphaerae]|uniref:Cobalt/nickel transport system permease protein n=1 Tax=Herbihabitans rhizosphaerae TaxID=1872711 RepID=A0A4Q7KJZ3_9PSEU|nr:cobalt ECF transporter T component CbiQ [Herbihabitans rhizosphaerae]RZS34216.1 cobalt/nickel transport system permease protein [Herbihabitans rhizosphaerae]
MSAHALHRPGDTSAHLLAPQIKIVSTFLFVVCVVATPRTEFAAFGAYLVVLTGVWVIARIPPRWLAPRALIEVPFVALAVLLPFVGGGTRTDMLGVSVSVDGALAGWNIVAKGTLGVLASLTLAATTSPSEILLGLQRLRVPKLIITVATLMLRYVELIAAEARRMRLARIARGHDPRFLWQVGATARGIGTLFVRTYERGERVHLAMLSRGWTGAMPEPNPPRVSTVDWLAGLVPAGLAAAMLVGALWAG